MKVDETEIGRIVQEYARARWGREPDRAAADRLTPLLARELRDRVDALGIDVERLLKVEPHSVIGELEALEEETVLENAGEFRPASDHLSRTGHRPATPRRQLNHRR